MDRAYEANPSANAPAPPNPPTLGYPTESGAPTVPGAWWFHMITEEQRAVLVAAGIVPDATKTNQLTAAIQALAQVQANAAAAAVTVSNTFAGQIGGVNVAVKYTVVGGKLVCLTIPPTVGNMNGIGMGLSGIPAGLLPATQKDISATGYWQDNNAPVDKPVYMKLTPSGGSGATFLKVDGSPWNGGAGTGPADGLSLSYSLD